MLASPGGDFREHLRILYDKDENGIFSQAELDSAHSILLQPGNIQSLEVLDCHANAVFAPDLSANTELRRPQ